MRSRVLKLLHPDRSRLHPKYGPFTAQYSSNKQHKIAVFNCKDKRALVCETDLFLLDPCCKNFDLTDNKTILPSVTGIQTQCGVKHNEQLLVRKPALGNHLVHTLYHTKRLPHPQSQYTLSKVGGIPSSATPKLLLRTRPRQPQKYQPHGIINFLFWPRMKMFGKTTQVIPARMANTLYWLLNNPPHHTTKDYANYPKNPTKTSQVNKQPNTTQQVCPLSRLSRPNQKQLMTLAFPNQRTTRPIHTPA